MSEKQIFQQNHFSLLIRGPGGFNSQEKNAKQSRDTATLNSVRSPDQFLKGQEVISTYPQPAFKKTFSQDPGGGKPWHPGGHLLPPLMDQDPDHDQTHQTQLKKRWISTVSV